MKQSTRFSLLEEDQGERPGSEETGSVPFGNQHANIKEGKLPS